MSYIEKLFYLWKKEKEKHVYMDFLRNPVYIFLGLYIAFYKGLFKKMGYLCNSFEVGHCALINKLLPIQTTYP